MPGIGSERCSVMAPTHAGMLDADVRSSPPPSLRRALARQRVSPRRTHRCRPRLGRKRLHASLRRYGNGAIRCRRGNFGFFRFTTVWPCRAASATIRPRPMACIVCPRPLAIHRPGPLSPHAPVKAISAGSGGCVRTRPSSFWGKPRHARVISASARYLFSRGDGSGTASCLPV